MNSGPVYSRTVIGWQLTFVHAGKTLHHLKSALLMSLASAGLGLAWFCCWLDRFLSGKRAGSWIISPHDADRRELEQRPAVEPPRPIAVVERSSPPAFGQNRARTIDSMIREKDISARAFENGKAPFLH
jgi:hypothetical protein